MYGRTCVTSSDIIPALLWTIFCDELSVRCWIVGAMFPPSIFEDRCVDLRRYRSSEIDVSTFGDQCVNLRRSMIDVSTFEDRCVDFRPSEIDVSTFDDRCEIMLLHLLKT